MKNFLSAVIIALFAGACTGSKKENKEVAAASPFSYFGDSINADGAIASNQLLAQLAGKDSAAMKVEGKIFSVCQKKGCWLEMEIGNNQTMRVTFKDYKFFVPKDASGKTAIIEGYAYNDTTSVEELRHYAEDAGKFKEEIEKITQPETNISFEARGVIIK